MGPVPSWVTNLAAAGATLHDGILKGKEGLLKLFFSRVGLLVDQMKQQQARCVLFSGGHPAQKTKHNWWFFGFPHKNGVPSKQRHPHVVDGVPQEIADKAAIMAKAKAGEIDEKYNISGTVSAAGKDIPAVTSLGHVATGTETGRIILPVFRTTLKFTKSQAQASTELSCEFWQEVLMAAGRFDEQYKVRERTFAAAASWLVRLH